MGSINLNELKTDVSILISVRNGEKYISCCLKSILDQCYANFEIIVIDDASDDKTKELIKNFKDKRIRYFRNEKWLGISKSRNRSLKYAKGLYIFFTDSDCVVSKDWIKQGLEFLKGSDCAGVEGQCYYVSKEYKPTFSDHSYPMGRGKFMTGNVAYKKSIVESVGGFDERYNYFEDRDLGLRILRIGRIEFNPNMIVYIQKEIVTPKGLIKHAPGIKNRVYLFKRFHDRELMVWRIVDLRNLAKILCPPLVFTSLFFRKLKTLDDYRLLPFTYARAISERLQLWRECAKERVFLI
jgi:glycosyltransferase involved in cell wall biosynthesis